MASGPSTQRVRVCASSVIVYGCILCHCTQLFDHRIAVYVDNDRFDEFSQARQYNDSDDVGAIAWNRNAARTVAPLCTHPLLSLEPSIRQPTTTTITKKLSFSLVRVLISRMIVAYVAAPSMALPGLLLHPDSFCVQ
jgi:hypothetical protein